MLYVGLDLSRKRISWHACLAGGELVGADAVAADRAGLARLVRVLGHGDCEVVAVVESMSGARFVHDQLEQAGWDVRVADAVRAKALAPLACKTDRIDAWVLAELGGERGDPVGDHHGLETRLEGAAGRLATQIWVTVPVTATVSTPRARRTSRRFVRWNAP